MGEIAAERGEDPGSTATGAALSSEAPGPQQEGEEPAPGADIGQDLAEWSDSGLSDSGIEQAQATDAEAPESPAQADLASCESAAEVGRGADVPPTVEVEVPIDDESEADPLAEEAVGESIAVDVLPDAREDVAAAAEDVLAADARDADAGEEELSVDPGVAAAAEEALAVDAGDADDTEETLAVDADAAAAEDEVSVDDDAVAVDEGMAASFDLAAELSEALDSDEGSSSGNLGAGGEDDGFAAVFREFKKGVSQTISEADHETHYDLGIAYREMGLLDDAINEFQLAMGSASRRVDCLHMLGICSHELDRAEEAVVHLETALEEADVTDAQVMAIRFELGLALESIGEIERAREAWEQVAAVDPSFCEVEQRLAALDEAKPEPEAEADPGFESFNDLFDAEEEAEEAGEDTASEPVEAQESFEDLIAEANEELEEEEDDDETGFPGAGDTASAAQEPEEPEEPAPPQPEPPRRRRKKKISFV
jgi:tetratricopeptide (TPR) repeat protein